MRAIDTNVLVRLIVRDDTRQAAAAEAFVAPGAWVSVLALEKAAWVLATVYELSERHLANAIEMLLDHDTVREALELLRAKLPLGFSNCLMLHLARSAGHLPLGTFDRRLARVDGSQRL